MELSLGNRKLEGRLQSVQPVPKGNLWLRRALPLAACLLLVMNSAPAPYPPRLVFEIKLAAADRYKRIYL